jgi:hypothetical protein
MHLALFYLPRSDRRGTLWSRVFWAQNRSPKKTAPTGDRAFLKCVMPSSPTPTKGFGGVPASQRCRSTASGRRVRCAVSCRSVRHTFSAGRRKSRRFARRFALGQRSQGFPPNNPSERDMPDRALGNFRANSLFRVFPKGQPGAGDRPLFHLLHRDAARPGTIICR